MNVDKLSVIIPVFNESGYVETLIESLSRQTLSRDCVELLFIDGGSGDDTVARLQQARVHYIEGIDLEGTGFDPFRILHNPGRIVSHALNIGVEAASNDILARLDAHTEYAEDYLEKVVQTLAATGADIVGGPTRVAARTSFQRAVGTAICSRFAVGDSRVHQEDFRGETDSVTFGAWRREVFRRAGGFDTRLVRNQDDEFHYRAKSLGFTIYQEPAIRLYYYPRDTARGLFRQYFQYGKYKPLVLAKVRSEVKLRHLIPACFVLYLLSLPLALLWPWWLMPLGAYGAADVVFSLKNGGSAAGKMWLLAVYPLIHIGYGAGFLRGLPIALSAGRQVHQQ